MMVYKTTTDSFRVMLCLNTKQMEDTTIIWIFKGQSLFLHVQLQQKRQQNVRIILYIYIFSTV